MIKRHNLINRGFTRIAPSIDIGKGGSHQIDGSPVTGRRQRPGHGARQQYPQQQAGGIPGQPDPDTPQPTEPGVPTLPDEPPPAPVV